MHRANHPYRMHQRYPRRCRGHEPDRRHLDERNHPALEHRRHPGRLLGVGHRSLGAERPHRLDVVRPDEVHHQDHPDLDGLGRLPDVGRRDGCPVLDVPCPG